MESRCADQPAVLQFQLVFVNLVLCCPRHNETLRVNHSYEGNALGHVRKNCLGSSTKDVCRLLVHGRSGEINSNCDVMQFHRAGADLYLYLSSSLEPSNL